MCQKSLPHYHANSTQHIGIHLYVACDDDLLRHLLNISTLCLAGSLGHAFSISLISTAVSRRLVESWPCHSEKHIVSLTKWSSAHGLSSNWGGNFDRCSSRLGGHTMPRPSAIIVLRRLVTVQEWKFVRKRINFRFRFLSSVGCVPPTHYVRGGVHARLRGAARLVLSRLLTTFTVLRSWLCKDLRKTAIKQWGCASNTCSNGRLSCHSRISKLQRCEWIYFNILLWEQ